MIEEYTEELKKLEAKMIGAENFAVLLPIFSRIIIRDKLTEKDTWISFGEYYKGMNFAWGINRGHMTSDGNMTITNYGDKEYDEYLFSIYINTLTLYASHRKYGLEKVMETVNVFFYDKMNNTFYIKDEHIEAFLDAIVVWENKAVVMADDDGKQKKIDNLQKEIDRLNS